MTFNISPEVIKIILFMAFFILLMLINNSVNAYFYGSLMSKYPIKEDNKQTSIFIKLRSRALVQLGGEIILMIALITLMTLM